MRRSNTEDSLSSGFHVLFLFNSDARHIVDFSGLREPDLILAREAFHLSFHISDSSELVGCLSEIKGRTSVIASRARLAILTFYYREPKLIGASIKDEIHFYLGRSNLKGSVVLDIFIGRETGAYSLY